MVGEILAVDGKVVRGTGEKGKPNSALQILSIYATESGITILQKPIENQDKTNEIPVFRKMLDNLCIEGATITADAMHCKKETCEKIIEKKGDYVFGLKGNQSNLQVATQNFLNNPVNLENAQIFETVEKNGGRTEKRICCASSDITGIPGIGEWIALGLKSVFSVTRIITYKGQTTQETGYYISSLDANAKHLMHVCRSQWKVESMHWALDVIWNEDNNNIKSNNAQKVMNVFRKLAHFAHKKHVALQPVKKRRSVKQNVLHALLNQDACFEIMSLLSHT